MEENNTFKSIKENLNLIILIPTILGGFWQLFELVCIDISFLRFFSITQVISDGLIILYFLVIIFLAYKFGIFSSKGSRKEKEENEMIRGIKFIQFIKTLLILILLLFIIIKFNKHQKITLLGLSSFIYLFIVFINLLLDLIGKENALKIIENPWFRELIFPIIFLSIIFFFIYSSSYFFGQFHKNWFIPEKLKNTNYIECVLKKDKSKYEILYFNDKYIFIELTAKNKSKIIEIIKFDEFFNSKNCS